ncbi:hypothetical protein GCM10009127_03160 [Alteraurantiacibacter aestuarii]|uniref:Acyltransferase family protein n=1 Tax=Alteraurantiacibacter aestuarii TaxID=650004 RepID=A0A844ZN19_9SPHN|nr:acyltransferase family protein [Alteraurantiacibacter aestuarii]MXO88430.1 acyltransferase family protein [Alteraurantiacibacter aestuarii]
MSGTGHPGLTYRADIDGLRSLAIIPVLLFHANLGVPGGFVGVDVFFVISGFLITRIIFGEMTAGTFSYADFYERRIRRLLPAAFVVFLASAIYALLAMAWFDVASFGRSLFSAALYLANFNFYWDTGYFSDDATTMLLLHTWSLAVEEQFYIVVPILFALLIRWIPRRLILPILIAMTIAGFVLCVVLTNVSLMAAYFLLPARAWELGVGGVLALTGTGWVRSRPVAEAITLAGAGLILASCYVIDEATPFPGSYVAMPVLGAAALLAAGHYPGTIMHRVLRLSPLVWIGKLSYSLYLWHWPVIVALSYGREEIGGWRGAIALLISLVLAYASLQLVETPVRRKRVLAGRKPLFLAAAGGTALFVAAGFAMYLGGGFPQRFDNRQELEALLDTQSRSDLRGECYNLEEGDISAGDFCIRGREGVAPTFALIGDSHAGALSPPIFQAADALGVSGAQLSSAGYVPMPGRRNLGANYAPNLTPEVFGWLDANPQIHTVVMAGYWQYEATSRTYRHNGTIFADEDYDGSGTDYNPRAFANALNRLVARFPDRQFVFLDDVPTGRELYVRHYVRGVVSHGSGLDALPRAAAEEQRALYAPILSQLAATHSNVAYEQFLTDAICGPVDCPLFGPEGQLRYSDGDHLSVPYSLQLSPVLQARLAPYLAGALSQSNQAPPAAD